MDTCFKRTQPGKLTKTEHAALAQLDSRLVDILAAWLDKSLTCAHCKRCSRRCEVLELPALDIGLVEASYQHIMQLPPEQHGEVVRELVQEQPELYHALRRCCFCGHCTAPCGTHMTAASRMREWRELFMLAGLMPVNDSKIVMVDNEWHIFSAYRAIYGVAYPEFMLLSDAVAADDVTATAVAIAADTATTTDTFTASNPNAVDTLFFPGCSLVSYAPELVRSIGNWLNSKGYRWALSMDCCGSPLMSAGLFDRSQALRERLLEQMRTAGITRVLTICPGCGEELGEVMGDEIDIVPLPELLLEHLAENSVSAQGIQGTQGAPASVTFFDSCHDRFDTRHGTAVRALLARCLPAAQHVEMLHHGKDTLCCGAGGAVASYDGEITGRRVWRVIDEAHSTGAETLVTTCPTCTYTIAQALLSAGGGGSNSTANGTAGNAYIKSHNYLELVFDQIIDWPKIFAQLEAMWTGEYGPWLAETFF